MKHVIFTLLIAIYAVSAFGQGSNLVFFAEQGERFFVIMNGIRQNDEAQTNVKIANIMGATVKVKVIFEDKALGEVDKNVFMPEEPSEMTINIRKDKSGTKYVLRMFDFVPIAQAPPTPPTATVVTYHTTPTPPVTSTTVSTTTTTTGTNPTGDNVNVNIGVNVPGGGFGMNVNVNDGMYYEENTSITTTTTTTTTGAPTPTPVPAPNNDHYNMPGYNGPIGCPWPMSASDFAGAKASIKKQSFSDSQFKVAQQIFNSNCLTSAQVKEIMEIFSFEETKLEFAKYAYGRTFDLGNYYKVNDAFTFSSSVDELDEYIQGR